MPLMPAKCPECGGLVEVNSENKAGICQFCGQPFVIEDAINTFNNYFNVTNIYNTTNQTTNNYGDGATVNVYEDKNKDFVIEAGVLKEYHGASTDVEIPEGVIEVSDDCFSDMNIAKVKFPSSLKRIPMLPYDKVLVDTGTSQFKIIDDIIYNFDETVVEGFIDSKDTYSLRPSVKTILTNNIIASQMDSIKHLIMKGADLKKVRCDDDETLNISKSLGIRPELVHELNENKKCVRCGEYILKDVQMVIYTCERVVNIFSVPIYLINQETALLSWKTFYEIWLLNNGDYSIEEIKKYISSELSEKGKQIRTLIILDLNRDKKKVISSENNTVYAYSGSLKNLFSTLFPNVEKVLVEEDTTHYNTIEQKQESVTEAILKPYLKKIIFENKFENRRNVFYSEKLPDSFKHSVENLFEEKAQFDEKKRIKNAERKRIEQQNNWKKQQLCQYCGGSFNLFNKCKNCGRKKDY